MAIRSHVRCGRELQRPGNAKCNVQSECLLKWPLWTERQIYVLIIRAQQQAVAGEIATESESCLPRCPRNQLQQAETRGYILADGAGKNCLRIANLRLAAEIVGVDFESLADSAPYVKVRSLSAAS